MTVPGKYLVALDPGSRRAGVAIMERTFVGAPNGVPPTVLRFATSILLPGRDVESMTLSLVTYLRSTGIGLVPHLAELVSEYPRKYASRPAAWDDVDDLRLVVRGVEKAFPWASCLRVAPGRWAAQTPKHIRIQRTARSLTADELLAVGWETLGLDGRDAIGLAQWASRPENAAKGAP